MLVEERVLHPPFRPQTSLFAAAVVSQISEVTHLSVDGSESPASCDPVDPGSLICALGKSELSGVAFQPACPETTEQRRRDHGLLGGERS